MESPGRTPLLNPLRVTPLVVYVIIIVLIAIVFPWIPTLALNGRAGWKGLFTAFLAGLSIYLLSCMGYNGYAWFLLLITALLGVIFVIVFGIIMFLFVGEHPRKN